MRIASNATPPIALPAMIARRWEEVVVSVESTESVVGIAVVNVVWTPSTLVTMVEVIVV